MGSDTDGWDSPDNYLVRVEQRERETQTETESSGTCKRLRQLPSEHLVLLPSPAFPSCLWEKEKEKEIPPLCLNINSTPPSPDDPGPDDRNIMAFLICFFCSIMIVDTITIYLSFFLSIYLSIYPSISTPMFARIRYFDSQSHSQLCQSVSILRDS